MIEIPSAGLLAELPAPPTGRTGWPWTEQTPPRDPGVPTPRISIVTPTYRHASTIEETIRSVLLQNHPNLEYFIMDGGSDDGTADILRRYDHWLSGWVSERDGGQTNAINKGFARATGDIRAYINSDDYYLPGAFSRVAKTFAAHPETDLLHGELVVVSEQGAPVETRLARISSFEECIDLWRVWWARRQFTQPEVFWSARIAERVGPFREDLHWAMDFEYWARIFLAGGRAIPLDYEVACFRMTPAQKSRQPQGAAGELLRIVEPWIWDPATPISPAHRRRMKADWLYQVRFLATAEDSIAANHSRLRRWMKLTGVLANHPGILRSSRFWERFRAVMTR